MPAMNGKIKMTHSTVNGDNRLQIIFVDSSTRKVLARVSASFQLHPKSMPGKGVKAQQVKIDAATLYNNVNKKWCEDDIVVEMKSNADGGWTPVQPEYVEHNEYKRHALLRAANISWPTDEERKNLRGRMYL